MRDGGLPCRRELVLAQPRGGEQHGVGVSRAGSGASAASSRLIHDGLRYLETGGFRLVRGSVHERQLLLRHAPHLMRPVPTWVPLTSWTNGSLTAVFQFADAGRTGSLHDLASHCCLAAEDNSVRYLPCLLILSLHALCLPARAQTLHGLTIGELLIPALKRMPKTRDFFQVGNNVAIKWPLSESVSLSATASPDTGKIVFLEEDWNVASVANASPVPGLAFGVATLSDIRRRFGSNGIGFASNAETLQNEALVGINCYELHRAPGVFVALSRVRRPQALQEGAH